MSGHTVARIPIAMAVLLTTPAFAEKQTATLTVEVKEVYQGRNYDPEHVRISVFDEHTAGRLLRLASAYDDSKNPANDAGADKMLRLRDRLVLELGKAPALARSSSRQVFHLRHQGNVVVFAAVSGEGEEMAVLHRRTKVSFGIPNHLKLLVN